MWGQWLGRIDGSNSGLVMLNIDRDKPFNGALSLYEFGSGKSSLRARISITQNGDDFVGNLSDFVPYPLPSQENAKAVWDSMPASGVVRFQMTDQKIVGGWETNINTKGELSLSKFEGDDSDGADDVQSWAQFKSWAIDEKKKNSGLIFRGHSDNSYPLRTTFHRTGRRDLVRYSTSDVQVLQRYVAAQTGRVYDVSNPMEHGELLFLAQHHGYPTPLLDWTESPYIAAFFAFSGNEKFQEYEGEKIRIHVFDVGAWHNKHKRADSIDSVEPYFSSHIMNSRDNRRAIPQQSVVTFSNVYNIEAFIRYFEKHDHEKYLRIIDIDKMERNSAMKDLEYMGITSASLFPSLDGTCAALKEMYF